MARPEYDPTQDPGNFPLEFVFEAEVAHVQYWPHHDWFTAEIGADWVCVDRRVLQYIYGLAGFARGGILYDAIEPAAIDYFRHEAFYRRLTPPRQEV